MLGKRILIVDDAAFMRMMIRSIVTKNGYEVVDEAGNGQEAVELYKLHKPDLITMDITMPDMNGIEGVKAIRSVDPGAKIIMCSAMGQRHMVMEAIEAGAKSFIVKPFKQGQLLQTIEKVLARDGL
ncbi:MAG: Chemotaxis protein CheY [Pelotomaculum sp. PtaU1.Bin035]|nr:MAG: Chemotaxis protein CheY [Pelotomaculum sp. PtaU1.Bin035]